MKQITKLQIYNKMIGLHVSTAYKYLVIPQVFYEV